MAIKEGESKENLMTHSTKILIFVHQLFILVKCTHNKVNFLFTTL